MNVFQKTGLAARRLRNAQQRAKGIEPRPGLHAGAKRWARYIKRSSYPHVKVKCPDVYLHAAAFVRAVLQRADAQDRKPLWYRASA